MGGWEAVIHRYSLLLWENGRMFNTVIPPSLGRMGGCSTLLFPLLWDVGRLFNTVIPSSLGWMGGMPNSVNLLPRVGWEACPTVLNPLPRVGWEACPTVLTLSP